MLVFCFIPEHNKILDCVHVYNSAILLLNSIVPLSVRCTVYLEKGIPLIHGQNARPGSQCGSGWGSDSKLNAKEVSLGNCAVELEYRIPPHKDELSTRI